MSNAPGDTSLQKLARTIMWILIFISVIAILTYYSKLLQPLIIAFIIWFMIRLVKSLLNKVKIFGRSIHRWIINILSMLIIFSILYGVTDILVVNIDHMIKKLPEYESRQEVLEDKVVNLLGFESLSEMLDELPRSQEIRPILTSVLNAVTSIVSWIIIILLYTIFLLLEETNFFRKLDLVLGKGDKAVKNREILSRISASVKRYAGVKIMMSFLTSLFSFTALLILGVDFPFLWAFIIFILNFIPYIGSFIATLLPAIFAGLQFGRLEEIIKVYIIIQLIQSLVASVIEPKVVGKTLNLSPLVVMIALTFWGGIWGVLGMLISVPITSVMVLIMSQFQETRKIAIMLSEKGELDYITDGKS